MIKKPRPLDTQTTVGVIVTLYNVLSESATLHMETCNGM